MSDGGECVRRKGIDFLRVVGGKLMSEVGGESGRLNER